MNKYDFTAVIKVENANPNGDPQAENRPRQYDNNHGYMTPVCIKHKIRSAMDEVFGQTILVKAKEDCESTDEPCSLKDRIKRFCGDCPAAFDNHFIEKIKEAFIDVRMFGNVFADKNSSHLRAAITMTDAVSVSPIIINETQITKCISLENKNGKGSDTMGMRYSVPFGLYVFHGSINPINAKKSGLTEADVELFKKALVSMFTCDASEARPEGSMSVELLVWNNHSCPLGDYPPAKTNQIVNIIPIADDASSLDKYDIKINLLDGLDTEVMWHPFYNQAQDKILFDSCR